MLLTKREEEVVRTFSETLVDNKSIGEILHVSEQTVKNHLSSAYRKIGVSNRTQLVQWYYKKQMKERT